MTGGIMLDEFAEYTLKTVGVILSGTGICIFGLYIGIFRGKKASKSQLEMEVKSILERQ